jgi:hypothetical protein
MQLQVFNEDMSYGQGHCYTSCKSIRNFAYKQYSNNTPYSLLFTCTFVCIFSQRAALSPTAFGDVFFVRV